MRKLILPRKFGLRTPQLAIIWIALAGSNAAGSTSVIFPMTLGIAQQVPAPGARAEQLPPLLADDSDEDAGDVTMDLPSRGPLRQTTARPGNWLDVTEDGEISEVLRRHWVRLDADGRLKGRISTLQDGRLVPARALRVSFLQSGTAVATTTTDEQGQFEVTDLTQGAYCLVAGGPNGFLAYSVNIVGADGRQLRRGEGADPFQPVQLGGIQGELEIDSVAVPPTFRTVRNLIRRYNFLDSDDSRLVPEADAAEDDDPQVPQELAPPAKEQGGFESQADMRGRAATTIWNHVVYLTPDGRLIGKLTSIDFESGRPKSVEQVTVHIIRNDRLVVSAGVERNGVFELRGLRPGSYSLVAAGRDGFGAIGFELRARERQAGHNGLDEHVQFVVDRNGNRTHLIQGGKLIPFPISIGLLDDPRNLRSALRPAGVGLGAGAGAGVGAGAGLDGVGLGDGFGAGLVGSGSPMGGMVSPSGGFTNGGTVGTGLGGALLGATGLAAGITGIATRGGGVQIEDGLMSPFMVDNPGLPPETEMPELTEP